MSAYRCEKIENCFANARSYAYYFDHPMTEEILEKERIRGNLRLKMNFRRPCYFLDWENGIQVKGLLNDSMVKVSFPEQEWDVYKKQFEKELEKGCMSEC